MGDKYLGQAAFGEAPPFHQTIQAVPADAAASAPAPSLVIVSTIHAPVASTTASALVPAVRITVRPSSVSATATFPAPDAHGGTPRADMPTGLDLDRDTFLAIDERTTGIETGRATSLAVFRRFTQIDLPNPTALALGGGTEMRLAPLSTTLILEHESTLEVDDRAKELVLDG
jgi:hypothetical protein